MNTSAARLLTVALAVIASALGSELWRPAAAADAPPSHPPTVLVTGGNRGIGFEFVRQYAERGWKVIATAREPGKAAELQALAAQHPNVTVETLDVADNAAMLALAHKYAGQPIDVLLNNAGLLGEPDKQAFGKALDYPTFEEIMRVNSYAPLLLAQLFLPNVVMSDQKKIVAVTSGIGSITVASRIGSLAFYRMSKAALNLGMRAFQSDVRAKGIRVGLVDPGEVETQMLHQSGFGGHGKPAGETTAALIKLIDGLNDQDAKAISYNGQVVPW